MSAASSTHHPSGTPSEGSPAIRRLVRWLSRRCLHWVYRDVRVFGADRVPESGAVLFIGNHPNDLPDVLQGFFVTRRPLRYIATLAAASSWPARKIYEGLGVIPVVRVRDARAERRKGTDMVAVNAAAGSAVGAALAAGHAVGVFPEGGVHNTPYVGRPRTGVAKMILEYIDNGAKRDVLIVPFGVQYESPYRPGSDCFAVVGTPVSMVEWRAKNATDAQTGSVRSAAALVNTFHDALQRVTRNSASWEHAAARDRLIASVAAALPNDDPLEASIALVAQVQWVVETSENGLPSAEWSVPKEVLVRMRTVADELANAVEHLGGIGTSARDQSDVRQAVGSGNTPSGTTVRLALGVPAAALGWFVHGPVFVLIWRLAHRFAKAPVDLVALTFVPGLHLVLLWYLLLTVGLTFALTGAGLPAGWSVLWSLLLPLVAPRLGDAAVAWRWQWRRWRLVRRACALPAAERERLTSRYHELAALWAQATPAFEDESIKLRDQSGSTVRSNSAAGSQQA